MTWRITDSFGNPLIGGFQTKKQAQECDLYNKQLEIKEEKKHQDCVKRGLYSGEYVRSWPLLTIIVRE